MKYCDACDKFDYRKGESGCALGYELKFRCPADMAEAAHDECGWYRRGCKAFRQVITVAPTTPASAAGRCAACGHEFSHPFHGAGRRQHQFRVVSGGATT